MFVSSVVAAAAQRSTRDVLYAAIIAGVAAIIGALVGAASTGIITFKAESKRQAHALKMAEEARKDERERERRAVVGTARALFDYFQRVEQILTLSKRDKAWWDLGLNQMINPPLFDDLKAVLGQLTSDGWRGRTKPAPRSRPDLGARLHRRDLLSPWPYACPRCGVYRAGRGRP
jgi:hypothetical protein